MRKSRKFFPRERAVVEGTLAVVVMVFGAWLADRLVLVVVGWSREFSNMVLTVPMLVVLAGLIWYGISLIRIVAR